MCKCGASAKEEPLAGVRLYWRRHRAGSGNGDWFAKCWACGNVGMPTLNKAGALANLGVLN